MQRLTAVFLALFGCALSQVIYHEGGERRVVEGLRCDFESGLCGLYKSFVGESWYRFRLLESGTDNVPSGDHTTGNGEYFAFSVLEDEDLPHFVFSGMELTTLTKGHSYCLTFWYFLSGSNPGRIEIKLKDDKIFQTISGKSTEWKQAKIQVEGDDKTLFMKFAFNSKQKGDLGIDDIELVKGKC